jgi:hypothetical protein
MNILQVQLVAAARSIHVCNRQVQVDVDDVLWIDHVMEAGAYVERLLLSTRQLDAAWPSVAAKLLQPVSIQTEIDFVEQLLARREVQPNAIAVSQHGRAAGPRRVCRVQVIEVMNVIEPPADFQRGSRKPSRLPERSDGPEIVAGIYCFGRGIFARWRDNVQFEAL